MSDFRQLNESILVSPQIGVEDIATAKELGISLIINNRPDGEADDQPTGDLIAQAAQDAGVAYCAIPISHAGFSEAQVDAMIAALGEADGKVLAYCRSGTRSTLLWSLAQAKQGMPLAAIASSAAGAGYDISPIKPALDFYVASNQ